MSEDFVNAFIRARRGSLEAFNERDYETAFADLAPDVEWNLLPWLLETGTLRGREAVIRYFSSASEAVDWQVESVEFIDAGERRVIVHQRGTASGRSTNISTGGPIDFFQIWEVGSDGLVGRVSEFEKREEALEAAGLREQPTYQDRD